MILSSSSCRSRSRTWHSFIRAELETADCGPLEAKANGQSGERAEEEVRLTGPYATALISSGRLPLLASTLKMSPLFVCSRDQEVSPNLLVLGTLARIAHSRGRYGETARGNPRYRPNPSPLQSTASRRQGCLRGIDDGSPRARLRTRRRCHRATPESQRAPGVVGDPQARGNRRGFVLRAAKRAQLSCASIALTERRLTCAGRGRLAGGATLAVGSLDVDATAGTGGGTMSGC